MEIVGDGEKSQAAVDLSCVRLRAGSDAESAVKVLTGNDEASRLGDVDGVEATQKAQSGHGAKRKPSVNFAVNVAEEGAVVLMRVFFTRLDLLIIY